MYGFLCLSSLQIPEELHKDIYTPEQIRKEASFAFGCFFGWHTALKLGHMRSEFIQVTKYAKGTGRYDIHRTVFKRITVRTNRETED